MATTPATRAAGQRSAVSAQYRADLTSFFSYGGRHFLQGVVNACNGSAVRGQSQCVVMPAKQDRLKQDCRDADQRDPATRRHSRRVALFAHDFDVAGTAPLASSRRRQAWVALTKLVTPTPSTAKT